MSTKAIHALFYEGNYSQVLQKSLELGDVRVQNTQWVVGSLAFLGKIEEAEKLFLNQKSKLSIESQSACHFFLGIGWNRKSQYKKSRLYFANNFTIKKANSQSQSISFYANQGGAFYFFYLGNFTNSYRYALKAQLAANLEGSQWMRALATDMLANNLIQIGKINEGIELFNQTQKLALKLNNNAFHDATEVSKLIYSCEYGVHLETSFTILKQKYLNIKNIDNFSKGNIGIELARQYTLRGEFNEAEKILQEIAYSIYASENRRQEVRLNLRWAELCYIRNQLPLALHYLRSANRCLHFVDQTYEIQILGLTLKVQQEFSGQVDLAQKQRLLELSQKFSTGKNKNILSRLKWIEDSSQPDENEQDRIHVFISQVLSKNMDAASAITQTGYFSWIYKFFDIPRGQAVILLSLEDKSITLISQVQISHFQQTLTNQNYKLLTSLKKSPLSKEQIIEAVWGYKYDSLRHDSLIYSAFSGLRKLFTHHPEFLQNTDDGYQLNARIYDLEQRKGAAAKEAPRGELETLITNPLLTENLNYRQLQILNYLNQNPAIDVKKCHQIFKTSKITASRDLSLLKKKNLILQIGKGRSIKYVRR